MFQSQREELSEDKDSHCIVWYSSDEEDRDYFVEVFTPLVQECKKRNRAMRIGTNHGSLSARTLSFYGDTPRGMVESAIEFADICRSLDFHNFVFSMKASNPLVMVCDILHVKISDSLKSIGNIGKSFIDFISDK